MSSAAIAARSSGILLHPTSLPGPHGSGDLGPEAHAFVDFLASAKQSHWQMLPIAPPGYGESPYSAQSAFAGSPWLISLDALAAAGLIAESAITNPPEFPADRVDFESMSAHREKHLREAHRAFSASAKNQKALDAFWNREEAWLDDFTLFRALKRKHGGAAWTTWAVPYRSRDANALDQARRDLASDIAFEAFLQFCFAEQWTALHTYARSKGVALIGDIPIFVAHDSADVWQNQNDFFLEPSGEPTFISGVPPDYFSRTGQRWGNPLYRWKRLKKSGFAWWVARFRAMLARFDLIRIDHFIGFQRYWRIPGTDATAEHGQWMKGPGTAFFQTVKDQLGVLPMIAEDLGAVTPAVLALRDHFHLPGIKIFQFAFGTDPNAPAFLPHNYPRNAVVYTGTHDNDTAVGWFGDPGSENGTRTAVETQTERDAMLRYLGPGDDEIHWRMIRAAMASVANLSIFPVQDVLGLGSEARMNRPGEEAGNWSWRMKPGALGNMHAERLADLTTTYERTPAPKKKAAR
ncbi:MAG: 4-alpha-glucanotransferase [Polyangiaceae bacterium]